MHVILLGPPGAGKGTQAERIVAEHGLVHLSTGDLLRGAVEAQSELGKEAQGYMSKGELVPDRLVSALVAEKLKTLDEAQGFLLDGFPRNEGQASDLAGEPRGRDIDHVIHLRLDDDEIVRRLLLRGRDDDTEEVIRNRLGVYERETSPLVALYEGKGLLRPIDATGTIEEIAERIRKVLRPSDTGSSEGSAA